MPTITVPKAELYKRLEREYTTKEFDELCFDFGIELDEDTTEEVEEAKAKGIPTEEPQLKIEIPANRYDLLCLEGLARSLRIFLQLEQPPAYKLSNPVEPVQVFIESSTSPLRPYFSSAILRLSKPLSKEAYASFIDLQDKLHQNLCRGRKLVAIGTHDLDRLQPPFRYMCKDPKEIKFAPLNKDTEYTAEELMTVYETDRHLNKYLPIIRDAPAYPIIYDQQDRVLSMPPIINSQHSKITLETQNIFIDVTATDQTKLDIVVNMVATMFAEYCKVPFEIEPVLIHQADGSSRLHPNVEPRKTSASTKYINASVGLDLTPAAISTLLTQMSLAATPSPSDPNGDLLDVLVPCTRPDILHECDIMEDAAIAYGYNKLPKSLPRTNTVAKPFPVNRLADVLRKECAMAGWIEVLSLILCSHDENFAWLNRPDPGKYAIALANPKTAEYQVVRTSLLPGLLKTMRENKSLALPLKIFEVSDVAVQDEREERKCRNYRRLGALTCDRTGGFEVVHGMLDRMMQILGVPFIQSASSTATYGYYIKAADDPTYFKGRAAAVYFRPKPEAHAAEPTPDAPAASGPLHTIASTLKSALPSSDSKPADLKIGSLGILDPTVLQKFELGYPCSALEIDVEPFL